MPTSTSFLSLSLSLSLIFIGLLVITYLPTSAKFCKALKIFRIQSKISDFVVAAAPSSSKSTLASNAIRRSNYFGLAVNDVWRKCLSMSGLSFSYSVLSFSLAIAKFVPNDSRLSSMSRGLFCVVSFLSLWPVLHGVFL